MFYARKGGLSRGGRIIPTLKPLIIHLAVCDEVRDDPSNYCHTDDGFREKHILDDFSLVVCHLARFAAGKPCQ